jgi:hypothetical protein
MDIKEENAMIEKELTLPWVTKAGRFCEYRNENSVFLKGRESLYKLNFVSVVMKAC